MILLSLFFEKSHSIKDSENQIYNIHFSLNNETLILFRRKKMYMCAYADLIFYSNPPLSLFSEFLAWIVVVDKQFIIIGNINCVTYKDVFRKQFMIKLLSRCCKMCFYRSVLVNLELKICVNENFRLYLQQFSKN